MSNSAKPPQAVLDQIIGLYNQGELEQTVSLSESLAKQYPNALILYDILGAAYMGLKNTEKTIASYQKALQLNPNHTDAYNNMGMALYDQGRFNEAVESYQNAVKLEPDFADAHYNLGNALKQVGNLKQAIESYKASLAINPNDTEVILNCGNALKSYGKFDQAIEIYAQALKIDSNSTAAQTNMENAIEEQAEIDKDIADYARITKLEIGSAEMVSCSGTFFKARGYLDAAIDSYNQALKINPDYAEAHYNMGIALKDKGELDAAIDSYKQAIKIKPDYAEAYNNIGEILQEKGNLIAAMKIYQENIDQNPKFQNSYYGKGLCLYKIGKLEESLFYAKNALEIDPTNLTFIKFIQTIYSQNFLYLEECKYLNEEFIAIGGKHDLGFLVNEMINCFLLDYRVNIDKNVGLCLDLIKITDIKYTNYQFNNAYTRYIKNLTSKLPIVLNDNVGMIGHIGDSHCLSIAHHELKISGKIYRIQPLICFGLKSYHLGVQTENNYQSIVKQYMSVLPKKSIIFLSVGEIDCRFEEGILFTSRKKCRSVQEITEDTVQLYLSWISNLNLLHNHTIYIFNVPAPIKQLGMTLEQHEEVINVILLFNRYIKIYAEYYNFLIVNQYSETVDSDGSSNNKYHCDNRHLDCRILKIIERQVNQTFNVNK